MNMTRNVAKFLFVTMLLAVFSVLWFRVAWISDDALISMRSVLNLTNGYGPVFNVGERVQAYTHTLWFFALAGTELLLKNIYLSSLVLSLLSSVLAIAVLIWHSRTGIILTTMCFLALILSKAFMDFSSSGLEVPLSYLLLALSMISFERAHRHGSADKIIQPVFLFGLCYLNRPDLIFFLVPAGVMLFLNSGSKIGFMVKAVFALSPVILWTLFSLFYYGNPFPNTALAKLNTGIGTIERLEQGGRYFFHSVVTDPVTPAIILVACVLGLFQSAGRTFVYGLILYLLYICYVGGDFMEGRFLAPAYFFSIFLMVMRPTARSRAILLSVCVLLFGVPNISKTILSGPDYEHREINADGIADERGFYYQRWGLLSPKRRGFPPPEWRTFTDLQLGGIVCHQLGQRGIDSGPSVSWIDRCALTDPVLSRLPARQRDDWRIGHYYRQIPTNYEFAHVGQIDRLIDAETKHLVELVHSVVRGDLWSFQRLKDVFRLQFYSLPQPTFDIYRNYDISSRDLQPEDAAAFHSEIMYFSTIDPKHQTGTEQDQVTEAGAETELVFGERGLQINVPDGQAPRFLHLGIQAEDKFSVFILNDGQVSQVRFPPSESGEHRPLTIAVPSRLKNYSIKLIPGVIRTRYVVSVELEE